MNTRAANNVYSKKPSLHPQNGKKWQAAEKAMASRRRSARERKLALLQDVENLKKKLRQEENVHRALQRAFNRPLGALPRLPPYLPQDTLELLAEVAVLEEEVVRLEEQVVNFRQGLYQEAASISSRRRSSDLSLTPSKQRHSRASSQSEVDSGSSEAPFVSRIASFVSVARGPDGLRHCSEQPQNEQGLALESGLVLVGDNQSKKNSMVVGTPVKKRPLKPEFIAKNANSPKMQCRIVEQAQESSSGSSDDRGVDVESEANKMSKDILNCLISIFVRMSSSRRKTMDFSSLASKTFCENEESSFRDPYYSSSELKKRDIGTYKHLYVIEAHSVDLNRKASASFLIRRLRILLDKLASVKVEALSHQQKLAFWINIYNSCIMNAFLEHGIPESPDMIIVQMQKATIKVGGHVLNALTIEHLILRLPYHLKYTCTKSTKNDEKAICRTLGLEWSEPLVTFALSCGSWSSPAVRVYTASEIESELEAAKRAYLQAAVGISASNKLVVPKLLDWYLLDFAKDMDALLDWICLQLPDELRIEAVKCIESKDREPLTKLVQVKPYNFSFRYLVYR
ncbi:ternary complex factor MIP1 leucine-zipper protein of unknown function [Perilla frutescens var. hirtella]|nr:ternary complex factor MIP1 leucine-zipper protein of unknown function [Perilla frutescens var. hirtella]